MHMRKDKHEQHTVNSASGQSIDLYVKDETPITLRSLLQYPLYLRFLLYFWLMFIAYLEVSSFLAGYGAAWFSGCHSVPMNNHCPYNFDYDNFNHWSMLTMSISAGVCFVCSPVIGILSDRFGRKPFLFLHLITLFVAPFVMTFHNDMMLFLFLSILPSINGGDTVNPVVQAYIADVLPQKLHLIGFSLRFFLDGVGIIIGQLIGSAISSQWDDHFNFYVVTGLYVFCGFYLFFFLPEAQITGKRRRNRYTQTLSRNSRSSTLGMESIKQSHKRCDINPYHSCKLCCSNPILFWCAWLYAIINLPVGGFLDIASVVLADTFQANSSEGFHKITNYNLIGYAIGLMVGPTFVLPVLRRYFGHFEIFVVTTMIMALAMAAFIMVCVFEVEWAICLASALMGIGFLSFASLTSILTDYSDPEAQGETFGPMYAGSSLVNIVTPMLFGEGYHRLKPYGIPGSIFAVALFLLLCTLLTSIGLKRAIQQIENEVKDDVKIDLLSGSDVKE